MRSVGDLPMMWSRGRAGLTRHLPLVLILTAGVKTGFIYQNAETFWKQPAETGRRIICLK